MNHTWLRIALMTSLALAVHAGENEQPAEKKMQAARRPKTYLAIFMNGYGGDPMPKDPKQFDKLLSVVVGQGHFNAVLCKYTPQREAACRKHKVRMVVDLLADGHHVYKNPKACEALLGRLRGNPTIAAYHVWADRFGSQGAGRTRDIDNVHAWDPTHATYAGTYRGYGIEHLAKSDFISFYDFSWKRGPHKNFPDLLAAWKTARAHGNRLGRYCTTDAGLPGKGNPNRLLYIQTTSIACGLRGAMWHIGSRIMDMNTFTFNQYGKDLAAVNAWLAPMRAEIAKIGLPTAIYSTPWTTDWNHRPVPVKGGETAMPPGLEKNPFPADFWLQPVSGEFLLGVSKYDGADKDVVFLANHDAYSEQGVTLKLTRPVKPRVFSRKTRTDEALRGTDGAIRFRLDAAGGAILLFE